ncbi:hypothetical protein [Halomonas organivorans]|uniref:Uncharacterized protein n=1 Tax=Halomonas organivorans TaxID=257772 RepID=A0A7W5C0C7_9GAMM|nr:hypothetical protein [Halomonas organivorans]MBB3142028.1 hypothetical protein [Halomonas organivorans]
MTLTASPVARSARLIRRQLLSDHRFLGLHQLWFALLMTPVISYGLALGFDPTGWWLAGCGFLVAWALAELVFLPRRVAIYRLASKESNDERCQAARRHGVALHEVQIIDRIN